MKNKFCKQYSTQVNEALDTRKGINQIEVPLKLAILKSLHAKWFIEMSNRMVEEGGRKVSMKGQEKAGIKEAVQKEMAGLPNLNPFSDIDPITEIDDELYSQAASVNKIQESSKYLSSKPIYTDSESDDE